jgi:hypothetical protein
MVLPPAWTHTFVSIAALPFPVLARASSAPQHQVLAAGGQAEQHAATHASVLLL